VSEITAILEDIRRQVTAGPGAFERVARRRDRKRRNQRIASAALALILAAAAIGAAIRVIGSAERQLPANPPITRDNVSRLHVVARGAIGGHPSGRLIASDGLVYAVSKGPDELVAFRASCGSSDGRCDPEWVADTGDAIPVGGYFGTWARDGVVYVTTDALYAFSATCGTGGAVCEPLWIGRVNGRPLDPSVGADAVFLMTNKAHMYSFPTSCATTGGICQPNWVSDKLPFRFFHPVVASGRVYVGQVTDNTYVAFPTSCGTSGATCSPSGIWTVPKAFRYGAPAVSGDRLFLTTGNPPGAGELLAYPTSCAAGQTCAPLWRAPLGGVGYSWPVVSDGKVFVPAVSGETVTAFSTNCQDPCEPLWTASGMPGVTPWPMAVENGLLFVPQIGGGIYAFPTDCGTRNATCEPLWTWGTGTDGQASVPVGAVTVTDGRVFAASLGGDMFIFSASTGKAGAASKDAGAGSAAVGLAAIVALGGVLLLLAHRRARSIAG
jgi:outer membrane protein assembly factor BamB